MTTRTLAVPGARITYDVTGSGPVLLLIPGGPADATGFAPIRPLLAEDHTVVTFDPAASPAAPRRRTRRPHPARARRRRPPPARRDRRRAG